MKKLNVVTVLAISVAISSCAQSKNEGEMPENISTSFKLNFPTAKKVEWRKENDREWEAEFKMNDVKYSSNFSNAGKWLETEYQIKKSEIPANVKTVLDANFSGYDIENAEVSETVHGLSYEFEIEVEGQMYEVSIDSEGNLIKKKEEENEADED